MYRGETITTKITGFPIPLADIEDVCIIFKNNFRNIIEKTLEDCTVSDEEQSIEFTLTQEESLLLTKGTISRSVIVLTKDGNRFESKSSPFSCFDTAKDEVIL